MADSSKDRQSSRSNRPEPPPDANKSDGVPQRGSLCERAIPTDRGETEQGVVMVVLPVSLPSTGTKSQASRGGWRCALQRIAPRLSLVTEAVRDPLLEVLQGLADASAGREVIEHPRRGELTGGGVYNALQVEGSPLELPKLEQDCAGGLVHAGRNNHTTVKVG